MSSLDLSMSLIDTPPRRHLTSVAGIDVGGDPLTTSPVVDTLREEHERQQSDGRDSDLLPQQNIFRTSDSTAAFSSGSGDCGGSGDSGRDDNDCNIDGDKGNIHGYSEDYRNIPDRKQAAVMTGMKTNYTEIDRLDLSGDVDVSMNSMDLTGSNSIMIGYENVNQSYDTTHTVFPIGGESGEIQSKNTSLFDTRDRITTAIANATDTLTDACCTLTGTHSRTRADPGSGTGSGLDVDVDAGNPIDFDRAPPTCTDTIGEDTSMGMNVDKQLLDEHEYGRIAHQNLALDHQIEESGDNYMYPYSNSNSNSEQIHTSLETNAYPHYSQHSNNARIQQSRNSATATNANNTATSNTTTSNSNSRSLSTRTGTNNSIHNYDHETDTSTLDHRMLEMTSMIREAEQCLDDLQRIQIKNAILMDSLVMAGADF